VTQISGYSHLSLSVTDVAASAAWYCEVLGFTVAAELEGDRFSRTRMRHAQGGITLTLTQHRAGAGEPFDEHRTGLDHVAFAVPTVADVEAFRQRFEELGVHHSDVRAVGNAGQGAAITLRDPDNIQLEVFAQPSG
jgi:glyoxylase I family protein